MDFDISSVVDGLDFSTNHFVDCGNGLMLTNGEMSILKRFGINYLKCNSLNLGDECLLDIGLNLDSKLNLKLLDLAVIN